MKASWYAPRRRALRTAGPALGLHLEQLDRPVARVDDDAGAGDLVGAGPVHLQALTPVRRPRATDADDALELVGRAGPVEVEIVGVELGRQRRLARLGH